MAQIKSFNEACKIAKVSPKDLPDFSMLPKKHQKSMLAYYKLIIIAQVLNEDWEPSWNDKNEYKYFAWFEIKADAKRPAGFGFSHTHCDGWYVGASVGSRLCFKTRELAEYAGKQFESIYNDFLNL